MPALVRGAFAGALLIAACRAPGPARAPAPGQDAAGATRLPVDGGAFARQIARALPDAAPPFVAGPLQIEDGYLRRRYQRGGVSVEITIASRAQGPGEYDRWIAQSRSYPQASLPLPQSSANGFFTCAGPGTSGACDLHIQMRAGFHAEVMGGGKATRADLDELIARIPLAALTD